MINVRVFIFMFLFAVSSMAQEPGVKPKTKSQKKAQLGIVSTSGAAVYKDRSFDSDPISYLDAGQKVKISKKKYFTIKVF